MIKKVFFSMPVIAIAIASTFIGCVDSNKDLYDSSFQMSNPMGEGFAAPDGFTWSMISETQANITISDEEYTIVEILSDNPFSTSEYSILAKGVSKQGQSFSQEINFPEGAQCLYIRKTDARQRVSISVWNLSGDQNTTRALKAATRSNSIPEKYPEETYDTTGAIELTGNANWNQQHQHLEAGKSYIIKNTFNGSLNHTGGYLNGGKFTLYVKGEWNPSQEDIQSANIVVLEGGKINSSLTTFRIADNSTLTIQSGGKLIGKNLNMGSLNCVIKNFGTISVNSMKDLNTSSILYNAPKAIIDVTGENVQTWEQSIFTKGAIQNFGTLTLHKGNLKINSQDATCHFYNGSGATVNAPTFIFGGIGVNDGTINVTTMNNDSGGNPTFTNNCSIYAKESFTYSGSNGSFIMNKGILAGGIEAEKFLAIPSFICGNSGVTLELNEGSMIKAGIIKVPNVTLKAAGAHSLLKATESISTGWTTKFTGNLNIECPVGEFAKNNSPYSKDYTMDESVELYAPGNSSTIVASCSEITEEPAPAPAPVDPEFPIILEDNQNYAYLFEDQWPLYGDYDMNDLVLTINKRKLSTDNKNKVKEFELSIDLCAVGATKSIAAAIMFDAISANQITEAITYENSSLHKGFNVNSMNIENGQDKAVVPLFDDAHLALGSNKYEPINSLPNSTNNTKDIRTINFTMKFSNPILSADAFNINKLNVFIIVGGNKGTRREVHVIGFKPSKLAETYTFGGNNDASTLTNGRYYISKENLAWGITVPTNFKWPLEYNNIKEAYPKFVKWVTSGGQEETLWWNDFDVNKVFQTNKN